MGVCCCESSVKQRESKSNSGWERETAVEILGRQTEREIDENTEAVYVSKITNIVDSGVLERST